MRRLESTYLTQNPSSLRSRLSYLSRSLRYRHIIILNVSKVDRSLFIQWALLGLLQDANFTEETGDGMSFDECLQLLAETFPVGETEVRISSLITTNVQPIVWLLVYKCTFVMQNPAVCMELPPVYASGNTMMSPEQPALTPAVLPSQLTPPQRVTPDLEEAWMEILSLPELQV